MWNLLFFLISDWNGFSLKDCDHAGENPQTYELL